MELEQVPRALLELGTQDLLACTSLVAELRLLAGYCLLVGYCLWAGCLVVD